MQGAWVPFLVRELRSHKPSGMAKKIEKKKKKERKYTTRKSRNLSKEAERLNTKEKPPEKEERGKSHK